MLGCKPDGSRRSEGERPLEMMGNGRSPRRHQSCTVSVCNLAKMARRRHKGGAPKEGTKMNYNEQKKRMIVLDPDAKSPRAQGFENGLKSRVIGQERAVRSITSLYQVFQAGMTNMTRPIGTMLFLGPTGAGKTHVVEAAADMIFGDPNAVIKIDCAEFQH